MAKTRSEKRPARDNLYRAIPAAGCELRAERADGPDGYLESDGMPTLLGHFARFNEWTEIDSMWEGRFMEMFAPGAFKKTIAEGRDSMRCLFQHGYDPIVGDKPLGPIDELKEDGEGAYYEVGLLDAGYIRNDVLPGLEADLYGASFRFRVIREDVDMEPEKSEHNPDGIPERIVKEAEVREFGPVTFPAYAGSTAGTRCRSITDAVLAARDPERLRQLLRDAESGPDALESIEQPADTPPAPETTASPEDEEPAGDADEPETPDEDPDDESGEDPAPPDDSAETESHPDDTGRRDQKPGDRLYGLPDPNTTPKWRL